MEYALFGLLLCMSAFFSASETALFGIGKVAHARLSASSDKLERIIVKLLHRPRDLLIAVLFGNELTNIALSIVSAGITAHLFEDLPLIQQALLSAAVVVPLLMLWGEVTPKTVAAQRAEGVARLVARPIGLFYTLARPVRWFLRNLTDALVRRLGGTETASSRMIDESEFRTLVDVGAQEGVVEAQERVLIHNVLDFDDLLVADVMRPFSQLVSFNERMPVQEAIEAIRRNHFSRIPVWRGRPTNIVGVVYAKDLLAIRWGVRRPTALRAMMRRPVFTPPQKPAATLLDEFRKLRTHMAIVVDEFGHAVGVCTMEDLLEELFGPITDNHPSESESERVR